MLTLQKGDSVEVASVTTDAISLDRLLDTEWLLTNERGGYSSSTVVGCNTRRYHGLLIGSLNPPVNRVLGLANCLEMVIFKGKVFELSTFEFNGKFAPKGFTHIKRFRRDTGAHFDFQLDTPDGPIELTKSVYLLGDSDTVAVVYEFKSTGVLAPTDSPTESVEFALRPFAAMRDFHGLQKSYAPLVSKAADNGLSIHHNAPGSSELFLKCCLASCKGDSSVWDNRTEKARAAEPLRLRKDPQWWFNFLYRKDRQRGQDCTEDLWSPGFYKCRIDSPARIVLWADLKAHNAATAGAANSRFDLDCAVKILNKHQNKIVSAAKSRDPKLATLYLAADQFVTKRQFRAAARESDSKPQTTILAGFPWFADWGRDAFIALPGLLLSTGRFDEAKSVLTTFAAAADDGMIPNRFDDYTDSVHFNSIDASLWFIDSAFQYLYATDDSKMFMQDLLPTIRWIVDSYHKGTRFDIHADDDGLITAGNEKLQLTWMDSKYGDVAFTPRYGKAVEINALWYNALSHLGRFYDARDRRTAERYNSMSDKVAASFFRLFWNQPARYLNDCILPDGSADASIRPNQIYAASLAFSPLSLEYQKSVVDTVQNHLLTPYGLRTLSPEDERYKGKYAGPQPERDACYHQGTVWPYLIGPFVQAYLKVNDFSKQSKKDAAGFIEPLLQHMTQDSCLGQISEIFDGDSPQNPKGCIAQAWSIAQLIRAYHLIND